MLAAAALLMSAPAAALDSRPEILEDAHAAQDLVDQQRWDEAEPALLGILERAERADYDIARVAANMGLVSVYVAQNRIDEALPASLRALEAAERHFGTDNLTTLQIRMGVGTLLNQVNDADAEPFLRRALADAQQTLGADHQTTLMIQEQLGSLLAESGQDQDAEATLRQAFEAARAEHGLRHEDTLSAIVSLATFYSDQSRDAEAFGLMQSAAEAAEQALDPTSPIYMRVFGSLGQIYISQRRPAEAIDILSRIEPIALEEFGPDNALTQAIQTGLGRAYTGIDNQRAETILRSVYERQLVAPGPSNTQTLYTGNILGLLLKEMGRHREAAELFRQTVDNSTAYPDSAMERFGLFGLGDVFVDLGRHAEGQSVLQPLFYSLRDRFGAAHMRTIAAATRLAASQLQTGEADALRTARIAAQGVREVRTVSSGRLSVEGSVEGNFDEAEALMVLADADWMTAQSAGAERASLRAEAFEALQSAMSGPADRAIVGMAVRRFAGSRQTALASLVRERQTLQDRWKSLESEYASSFDNAPGSQDGGRQDLRRRIAEVNRQIARIDDRLEQEFPDYFSLTRPRPVDVASAQATLGEDDAILLVMPGELGTHVVALSREDIRWSRSDWSAERVSAAVQRLRWYVGASTTLDEEEIALLESDESPGGFYSFDRATAHALHQQLVAPAAAILEGKRQLFVIAGGELSALPFSLLVTEPPTGEDNDPEALRDTRWLADAFALTHVPSVRALSLLRGMERAQADAAPASFVGFGDPLLSGSAQTRGLDRGYQAPDAADIVDTRSPSAKVLASVSALRSLPRLPGTARELRNMRTALGAPEDSVRLESEATETAVRGADLSDIDILAFATHGLTSRESGQLAEAGLVMTPPASASAQDDGYLAASEVTTLQLDAGWIILSACNTATGEGAGAQGLSSLARAFFYAGAQSLLASHWPVNDEVAAKITVRTIQLEQERPELTRAEAFQQAMLEIRNDTSHDGAPLSWAHPAFWAPFTLIGDGTR